MFIDNKTNITDEINHINCTLGQITEIDRRLRVENRNYISQIKDLIRKNEKVSEDLGLAKQMEKKERSLRFRDIGILLLMFAAFAMYVTYVSF